MREPQNIDIQKEIAENLAHIKTLTTHKQSFGRFTSPYFIIWGAIWVAAFPIIKMGITSLTVAIWCGLAIVGWLFTGILFLKQKKTSPMPLFLEKQLQMICIGILFLVIVLSFFIAAELLTLSPQSMALYILLLTSAMYLLLGIILTKELFITGIWLGLLGILTYQFFLDYLFIIFSLIGGGCLLLTGLLLQCKGKKDE